MFNNVLQSIENVAIWPMISFVIFFLFFLCLLLWVFAADKEFIKYMGGLPIQDQDDSSTENKSSSQN